MGESFDFLTGLGVRIESILPVLSCQMSMLKDLDGNDTYDRRSVTTGRLSFNH